MLEREYINEYLVKSVCPKCGVSLGTAKLIPVTDVYGAFVAHAVCSHCQAESMVTITSTGGGTMALVSDLSGEELKSFVDKKSISYDELIDLHKRLSKKSLWSLLQSQDKFLEKNQKTSNTSAKFQA